MPFDYEGAPKARVTLIERGVTREIVTDHKYAEILQRPNTGHDPPAPTRWGRFAQPDRRSGISRGGLIANTKRGLW